MNFEFVDGHPIDPSRAAVAFDRRPRPGASPAELFQNAALAMMAIAAETDSIDEREELPVELNAEDYESLMVDWLSEVLYLFDASRFAGRRFVVDEISSKGLRARLFGELRDPRRHPWELIIKAVTYHQLKVVEKKRPLGN